MCGIVGVLGQASEASDGGLGRIIERLTATMRHRGPDDQGVWVDEDAALALGQRRLSIIDLSPAGHQPMVSADGRCVITYNGEIYNAAELRRELPGVTWRGHSDTEVLLEACATFGVEATVRRLNGMFAFGLWDRRERALYLVRDRLGIKPLYWGHAGKVLVFGSELKALRAHPDFDAEIDREALAAYARLAYVPAPHSIYRHASKLQPGTIVRVCAGRAPQEIPYWSMQEVVRAGSSERLSLSDATAVDELEHLLGDAVGRRMVADVPLGAFLSGGVDSSTVVALMQAQSARPIRTFSIGFTEKAYDEAVHAKAVASHLGTDHTELYVTPAEARDVIPKLPEMFDEPFGDSSQIPTYLVSELCKRHVTVSLSGDGGDELFAGYGRYLLAEHIWRRIGWLPVPARRAMAALIKLLPPARWSQLLSVLPDSIRPSLVGDKMHKFAGVLNHGPEELYLGLVSQWKQPDALVIGGKEPRGALHDGRAARLLDDRVERMQFLDSITYLPDDILTKVDRASMAVSLEARVPLLDHRVVEFAWRLPSHMRIRNGQTKWLLREVLYRHVPRSLVDRPKMGFGVPIDAWLRGPLREWAEDLIGEQRLRDDGLFAPRLVRDAWKAHLSGQQNLQYPIWTVLMAQAWLANDRLR